MSPAAAEIAPGKPIQRWSAARKRDVVLRLLRGESIEAISRQIGIEPFRLEQWRERALACKIFSWPTPGNRRLARQFGRRPRWRHLSSTLAPYADQGCRRTTLTLPRREAGSRLDGQRRDAAFTAAEQVLEGCVMDDRRVRQTVIDELDLKTSVDPAHIGVTAEGGSSR